MKCPKCDKKMKYVKNLKFNDYNIDGWKCACGEIYYNPEQAQKILLLNQLKKESIKAKLGKVRSNLILRLPKNVEKALNLEKGESVIIKIEDNTFRVIPA